MIFDLSKNWYILSPDVMRFSVLWLAGIISALRMRLGLENTAPEIIDGAVEQAPEGAAEIVINWDKNSEKMGFSWRAAEERVEIYAHSPKSLDNAISDFLNALERGAPYSPKEAPAGEPAYHIHLLKSSNHVYN